MRGNKVILFSLFFFCIAHAADAPIAKKEQAQPSFIVPKATQNQDLRRVSKNRLKEDIGTSIKGTLHNCAELTKLMGKIQIELADVQKNLFEKVEELVDNKRPFKSASKTDLADASKIMQDVKLQVLGQVKAIENLKEQINNNKCLKKVT